jgi:carboxypeptidase Taq
MGSIGELLGWDQETMMPPGGAEYRAQQLSLLARLHHEKLTSTRIADLLQACEEATDLDADSTEAANVRELRRDHDRAAKVPADLVGNIAATASTAQGIWAEARKENDFARFLPWLEKTVELARNQASCYGWEEDGEPWDALAEGYERGCTAASVAEVFAPLRERLGHLLERVDRAQRVPNSDLDAIELSAKDQMAFCRFVAESLGFDFDRGRLDLSTHPFCGGSHCNDVRMTTRFQKATLSDGLGSTMHESGHGLYEQGLLFANVGTPMGSSVSLGIHESQSRLWENQVGRSRAFWEWCTPHLGRFFGNATASITAQAAFECFNRVQPSLIRVEADEATYNMHIMIRFELERVLLDGRLAPADLPGEWNRLYREYLNIEVPDDTHGCLQDVHWSLGALGYFPTYTLGNLYSAQIFEAAKAGLPGLDDDFANGRFERLREWLKTNIHEHGRRYTPSALCERITGRPLSADPLMHYLEGKYATVYSI